MGLALKHLAINCLCSEAKGESAACMTFYNNIIISQVSIIITIVD